MNTTTDRVPHKGDPVRRGRRLLLVLAAVAALGLTAAGVGRLWRPTPPRCEPPAMSLDGVEPAVAKAVEVRLARVRAEPASGRAWGDLGVVLTAHGLRREADPCFAEAERLDPREPAWPYLRALTLLEKDPTDGTAVGLLGRAADLCGADPDAPRLTLAQVLLRQGRSDEAEKQFRLLLQGDPGHPPAHLGLARLALVKDEPETALGHLQYCLNSPCTRQAALRLTAQVRQGMGDRDAARAALQQAEAAPDDAAWPDPFLEEVREAMADRASRLQLAVRRQGENRADEAEDVIAAIREDDPGYADYKDGEDRLKRGDPAGAERLLREAVRLAPDWAEAHYLLGVALLRQQDAAGAAACFRRALQLKPDHAAAYDQLGQALESQGDQAGAMAALRTAARYLPQQADLQRRLGELLAANGRDAEALDHLRRAVFLDPEDRQASALMEKLERRAPSSP